LLSENLNVKIFGGFMNFKSVFLLLSLLCHGAFAADLYVSTSGNNSNSGSASAPFRTIQKAASVATEGTTVHVAPGIYSETIRSSINGTSSARIRFVSDSKWGAIIKPPNGAANTAWESKGAYVTIENFEVDCSLNPACLNGILLGGSNSIIKGNHVHHIGNNPNVSCTGAGGSGINATSYWKGVNMALDNNIIHHIGTPTCRFIQGIYHSSTGTIKNNLVYQVGAAGLHLWHDAHNIDIINNTVFASGYGVIVGAGDEYFYFAGANNVHVANNIFFDNERGISEQGNTGTGNTYVNNIVFKNSISNISLRNGLVAKGTIAADPGFINYLRAGGGNYHLASNSPGVDRGTSNKAPPQDLDNVARPQGPAVDIGAYELKVAAQEPIAKISLSASSLSFANLLVGSTSAAQVVTITSSGTAPLIFASGLAINGDFAHSGSGTCAVGVSYAPGSTCTVSILFKPLASGLRSGSVKILSNASAAATSINLSGTGLAPAPVAKMSVSAGALLFGDQLVGSISAAQVVTIQSTGTAALSFPKGFVVSGDFTFGGLGTCKVGVAYAPGSSCTASIVFKPMAIGSRSGSLSILSNASSTPVDVKLSGTGTSPKPAITLSTKALVFSSQTVGTTSALQVVTVTNTGTAALSFPVSFSITGDFAFGGSGTCKVGVSYAPGASCTATVVFKPKAIGARSGVLSLPSNASTTPASVTLSGTGK